MEGDFIAYTLNQYVNVLYDMKYIDESEYNVFIYGTATKKNTELTKLGLTGALINRLQRDKQIDNIEIDELGHLKANSKFKLYLNSMDDLLQFEVKKYISI